MLAFKPLTLRHPTLRCWDPVPVEDVKGILLAGARGGCSGATPGGQAPEGALPGV